MDFVEAANARYDNVSNPERVFFHGLIDYQQSQVLVSALNIFRRDWINAEHLAALRRAVSKGFWFTRLPYFFSASASSKLLEFHSEVNTQIEIDKRFLGPDELDLLVTYSERILELAAAPSPRKGLSNDIAMLGNKLLVVTEQSRWSTDLRSFAAELGPETNILSVGSMGYLSKVQPGNFDALVFLGSPLEISDAHARLLLCSGLATEIHCWIPGKTSFSSRTLESHVFGTLRPTLSLPSYKQKSFEGEPVEVTADLEEVSRRVSVGHSIREVDLDPLGTAGTERCLLLRIDEDAVIPIEEDAARVSTLVLDQVSGQVREEQIDWPLSGPGAIVFALVEQGEQDFLWEAVKVEMGPQFLEFSRARDEWLGALHVFVQDVGIGQAEHELGLAGVTTSSHLANWIANDRFTRPRADLDFRALLEFLIHDQSEINRVMGLTSKFRGELNQVAKTARKLVCEALDSENWSDLQGGENLDVLLEEFGDAVYRVGKVLEISQEVVLVSPGQVRRVVGG